MMILDISKLENVKKNGLDIQAACPVCRKSGSDQTGIHLKIYSNGKYSCAVHHGNEEHNKAIYALVGKNGSGDYEAPVEVIVPQVVLPKTWPVSVLDKLIKDHSYWNGRNISTPTIESFRGGVAKDGQMKGRYVFPIFDDNENIVGFTGRVIFPNVNPPWKHLGATGRWVWGDLDEIESTHRVILVESVGDLLALRENGIKDVLCLFGATLSSCLLSKIIALNPKLIIISTNRDFKHTVGQRAAQEIRNKLSKFFDEEMLEITFPPERKDVKDWGEATKEEITQTFGEKP